MKMGDNWHVNAPWAQLVCSTEIPEDKVIKFLAISNVIFVFSYFSWLLILISKMSLFLDILNKGKLFNSWKLF